jgi:hypothetical protein
MDIAVEPVVPVVLPVVPVVPLLQVEEEASSVIQVPRLDPVVGVKNKDAVIEQFPVPVYSRANCTSSLSLGELSDY